MCNCIGIITLQSMEERKNNSIDGGEGGVTWAYEVSNDAMVCPLIVEDLSTPGQILIEVINCCRNQDILTSILFHYDRKHIYQHVKIISCCRSSMKNMVSFWR